MPDTEGIAARVALFSPKEAFKAARPFSLTALHPLIHPVSMFHIPCPQGDVVFQHGATCLPTNEEFQLFRFRSGLSLWAVQCCARHPPPNHQHYTSRTKNRSQEDVWSLERNDRERWDGRRYAVFHPIASVQYRYTEEARLPDTPGRRES